MFKHLTLLSWSMIGMIFIMCSITPHIAKAELIFNTRVDYSAGDSPHSLAIGYLNAAGYLDIVVAN